MFTGIVVHNGVNSDLVSLLLLSQSVKLPVSLVVALIFLFAGGIRKTFDVALDAIQVCEHFRHGSLVGKLVAFLGIIGTLRLTCVSSSARSIGCLSFIVLDIPRASQIGTQLDDLAVFLLGQAGILIAAVARLHVPVAGAGLVVPVALQADDGARNALLILLHDTVRVDIIPDIGGCGRFSVPLGTFRP